MQKMLFSLLFGIGVFLSLGQEFSGVICGSELTMYHTQVDELIEREGKLFVLYHSDRKYYLMEYSAESFEYVNRVDIRPLDYKEGWFRYVGLMEFSGGFHLIYKVFDAPDNSTLRIVVQTVSKEAEVVGVTEIVNIRDVQSSKINLRVHTSRDSSKAMVSVYDSRQNTIRAVVFDSRLRVLNDVQIIHPLKGQKLKVTQMEVNDDGEIFAIGYPESRFERYFDVNPSMNYFLLKYHAGGISHVDFSGRRLLFEGLSISLDVKRDIVVSGFCHIGDEMRPSGVYYAEVDPSTMKLNFEEYGSIDVDRINKLTPEMGRNGPFPIMRYKSDLESFVTKDFRVVNGKLWMIAEREYLNRQANDVFYHQEEILLMCFNERGKLEWFNTIPKTQMGPPEKGITSYFCNWNNEGVTIIYNDILENVEMINSGLMAVNGKLKKMGMIQVHVGENGSLSARRVLKMDKKYRLPSTALVETVNNESFIGLLCYPGSGKKTAFWSCGLN